MAQVSQYDILARVKHRTRKPYELKHSAESHEGILMTYIYSTKTLGGSHRTRPALAAMAVSDSYISRRTSILTPELDSLKSRSFEILASPVEKEII